MPDTIKVERIDNSPPENPNLKLVLSTILAVVVALGGSIGVNQAIGKTDSSKPAEQYLQDRSLIIDTLNRHEALLTSIDGKVTAIRIQSAQDRALLRQLLRRKR